MSLLSTLAKVAVGVAIAKGVGSIAKQGGGGAGERAGSGSMFGGRQPKVAPGNAGSGGLGGLGDLLSGAGGAGRTGGGLGDLLSGGGLGDLLKGAGGSGALGSVLAGRSGSGGGLGGLLEGLSNSSRPGAATVAPPASGSLGDLLNQSLDRFGEPDTAPSPDQEASAGILLRAMLQAAKSDGRIDAEEKKNLLGQLGEVSREEMAAVTEMLERPVDVEALARDVPAGMGAQVYSVSLLAIDLDSQQEAAYLNDLAGALGISPDQANAIHDQMDEPRLYS